MPKEEIDLERFASCPFPVYEENIQLVLALTDALGIGRETAYAGILKTSPDIGMYTSVETGDCSIRNAFAANDAVSFGSIINAYTQPFLLLYNHRKDRGYRMEAFAKAIRQSAAKPVCIGVIGEHKKAVRPVYAAHNGHTGAGGRAAKGMDSGAKRSACALRGQYQGRRPSISGGNDRGGAAECMISPLRSAWC